MLSMRLCLPRVTRAPERDRPRRPEPDRSDLDSRPCRLRRPWPRSPPPSTAPAQASRSSCCTASREHGGTSGRCWPISSRASRSSPRRCPVTTGARRSRPARRADARRAPRTCSRPSSTSSASGTPTSSATRWAARSRWNWPSAAARARSSHWLRAAAGTPATARLSASRATSRARSASPGAWSAGSRPHAPGAFRHGALRDIMRHGELVSPADAVDMARASLNCSIADHVIAALGSDEGVTVHELDRITCPVLLATPEHDRILPPALHAPRFRGRDTGRAPAGAARLRARADVGRHPAGAEHDRGLRRASGSRTGIHRRYLTRAGISPAGSHPDSRAAQGQAAAGMAAVRSGHGTADDRPGREPDGLFRRAGGALERMPGGSAAPSAMRFWSACSWPAWRSGYSRATGADHPGSSATRPAGHDGGRRARLDRHQQPAGGRPALGTAGRARSRSSRWSARCSRASCSPAPPEAGVAADRRGGGPA